MIDKRYVKLKFIQGNKVLEVDNDKYKLINIEGLDYPEIDVQTTPNANTDGSTMDNNQAVKRNISIEADYQKSDIEVERERLISFFNFKNAGTLIVDYCGVLKSTEYKIKSFSSGMTKINELGFNLELVSIDPYLHDIAENKVEVALWHKNFHFPVLEEPDHKFILGYREQSLIANIVNTGDVPVGLIIEFKADATVKNPSLFNINTRKFLKINTTMTSEQTITVNTNLRKKKVILNNNGIETNIMNLLDIDSDFLRIEHGDNLFRYDADEGLNNLQISIYYNPGYLGV